MKIRDLFDGYGVTIRPLEAEWVVQLVDPLGIAHGSMVHGELPAALDIAHEWLLMLTDETELRVKPEQAAGELADRMREYLARRAAGEPVVEPAGLDAIADRDELREWFERQMGN